MLTEQQLITAQGQRIAIVGGLRTPFVKKDTGFKDAYAIDLGTMVTNELLNRLGIDRRLVQQLIFGQVTQHTDVQNIARAIAVHLSLPQAQAYTMSSSCVTGLQTVVSLTESILTGSVQAGIAGAADSISNSSISLNSKMLQLLKDVLRVRGIENKYQLLKRLSLQDFKPHRLNQREYVTDLSVADVSEQMARTFGIIRQEQDDYTARSHRLAQDAWSSGLLRNQVMLSFPPPYQDVVSDDNLIEKSLNPEQYCQYPPISDRKYGSVTEWNIPQVCDGAGAVMLMREDVAKAEGVEVLGYIRSYAMTGNDVWENMLTGATYASSQALLRADLALQEMDLVDMHESSAAQLLANLRLFESGEFAQQKLNRTAAMGVVDMDKLNVQGGSLAYGNPRAVTSLRVLIQTLFELQRRNGQFALVAASGLGGLGGAMVLERE